VDNLVTPVNNPRVETEGIELTIEPRSSTSRYSQSANMTRLAGLLKAQEEAIGTLRKELKKLQESPTSKSVVRTVDVGSRLSINLEFRDGNPVINPTEGYALMVAFQNMIQVQVQEEPIEINTEYSPTEMYNSLTEQDVLEII
jgi:hypothetical protein